MRRNLTLLALVVLLGSFMISTGPVLASQSQSRLYETDTSPTNFTLPPGGEKLWFGQGNYGGGVRDIVYFAITSPPEKAEFRVTAAGTVNGIIFSTQSDYTETSFTIPAGTKYVNYTIFNPTGAPITVLGAEVRFYTLDHPDLWIGSFMFHLGIAIVVVALMGSALWLMRRRTQAGQAVPSS